LRMTDRVTGSDVTGPDRKSRCDVTEGRVTPWVRACATRSWGFPPFFSDMMRSTPRPRSHCVISKSTFDSQSHPIEGHSAFIQACDWLYIEAAVTIFFS